MTDLRPEVKKQSIGDTDIQYLSYEGEGPAIIFLHATGFLPWIWHPIARALAPSYRILAPYFCDHRDSDPKKGGLAWLRIAEDLKLFCDALNLENAFFVGHSMGATVSAMANVLFGAPAEKMVLIEPIFLPQELYNLDVTVEQHPLASKSIKRRNSWNNKEEVFKDFKSKKFFQSWDDETLSLYINHGIKEDQSGGLELACSPLREASLFMGGNRYNPWPILPEVSCPVLVVEGEQSENRPFIDLVKLKNQIPLGEYLLVKEAGHLIPMEKPAEIGRVIKSFIERD